MNHYPISSSSTSSTSILSINSNNYNYLNSITMTKCKLLPTKTISRGKFRGINDIRRFQCYNSQCNLNFNEYQLCKYCAHVPYVSLPLRIKVKNNLNDDEEYNTGRTGNNNNNKQYRSIKIDYIPPTRSNAIIRRNSSYINNNNNNNNNNKLIVPHSVTTLGTTNSNGSNGNGDLTSKLNEFWDHLEMGKLQIKQRFMDIKIQKHKLSFKKRSFSAPPMVLGNDNDTTTNNNNNNNNENIYYSTGTSTSDYSTTTTTTTTTR